MLQAETNPQNFYKVVNKPDRHVKWFILILFCTFLQALLIYYLKYIKTLSVWALIVESLRTMWDNV